MQSPVELALYRWCGSHPEQDELPDQDGLSAVASSELPGWTSQLGAAMLVTDPLVLLLPHRAGLPTIPKTAASWASRGWEKFPVRITLLLPSSRQHSCCHQQSGTWLTLDKSIAEHCGGRNPMLGAA